LNNNIYVTGSFTNSTLINSYSTISSGFIITSTLGRLIGGGGNDAFIAKYNTLGTAQWATNIGGSGSDTGNDITNDILGNIYVTGRFVNSTLINSYSSISSGVIITSTFGRLSTVGTSSDTFITKYNPLGIVQWATNIGGTSIDGGNGITTDTDNNVYVTGYYNFSTFIYSYNSISSNGFISTNRTAQLLYTGGSFSDAFVVKYNSDGQFVI
jgi:hypothetical protein